MPVLLVDQRIAFKRSIEIGHLLQRMHAGLDHEGQHREFDAGYRLLCIDLGAEGLECGDVGFVMVGDMRNHHPVAMQVCSRQLSDARQRTRLDRPEFREIDLRPGQQPKTRAVGITRCLAGRLARSAGHERFDIRPNVIGRDALLGSAADQSGQFDAELAGKLAHRRRGMRQIGRRGILARIGLNRRHSHRRLRACRTRVGDSRW